jgi:uncharacterized membrane protein YciS (DUF1049 family)
MNDIKKSLILAGVLFALGLAIGAMIVGFIWAATT